MAVKTKAELKDWWAEKLSMLAGRRITQVSYMSDEDRIRMGWERSPITIIFDDGTILTPLMDEEGNGPGALEIVPGAQTKTISRVAPPI
jgi:hypothetical protein